MSVDNEIEVVTFLLGSFFGNPYKNARTELIVKQYEATENEYLKTYANFSEPRLRRVFDALLNQLAGE